MTLNIKDKRMTSVLYNPSFNSRKPALTSLVNYCFVLIVSTSFSRENTEHASNFLDDTVVNAHIISSGSLYVSDTDKEEKDLTFIVAKANELNNPGPATLMNGDMEKTLDHFRQNLATYKAIDNKEGVANSLYKIGNIYDRQNNLENALNVYIESFKMYQAIGNKRGIARSLISMGNIYDKQGDLESALADYDKSLKIEETIGDKQGIATALNNIGTVLLQEKKPAEALKYAEASLQMAKESGYIKAIANADLLLTEVDSAMGNTAGALEFFRQYITFRDSLANEQMRGAAIKKQMQYEFDKRHALVIAEHKKILENQHLIAEEKSRKQRSVIWLIIGGFTLLLVFAAFIFRALKITRKQKKIIENKNREITDSIHYAKRIQLSLLPTEKYIDKHLKRLQKN